MVQPGIESKFSEYGRPNTDSGRPNCDKKFPMPITPKKTVLRDLQNENRITVPKSVESPVLLKENGPDIESIKVSCPERTEPEHLVNQSQPMASANGHLVYVRRKPEADHPKSSIHASRSDNSFCSPQKKVDNQHQTIEGKLQVKEPSICIPENVPMPTCSLTSFPSGNPSVPSSVGKSPSNLQATGSDNYGVTISLAPSDYSKSMNNRPWEERYCRLQDVLEMLDRSNQEDYVQMLRSLSSEGLSLQAIGLEKRSIQLSLVEANELQRVQQLDVLGKYAKTLRVSTGQQG